MATVSSLARGEGGGGFENCMILLMIEEEEEEPKFVFVCVFLA